MSKKKNNPVTPAPEEEVIVPVLDAAEEPTVIDKEPKFVTGTVVGCRKLNVREQMQLGAKVLCELPVSTEVQVFADENHDEWYHVSTASGIDGFCMKKYIKIKRRGLWGDFYGPYS